MCIVTPQMVCREELEGGVVFSTGQSSVENTRCCTMWLCTVTMAMCMQCHTNARGTLKNGTCECQHVSLCVCVGGCVGVHLSLCLLFVCVYLSLCVLFMCAGACCVLCS